VSQDTLNKIQVKQFKEEVLRGQNQKILDGENQKR